jgi:hypothetical protein
LICALVAMALTRCQIGGRVLGRRWQDSNLRRKQPSLAAPF